MNYKAARETMVDSQIRPNDVADPDIVSAFLKTPREAFVPSSRKPVVEAISMASAPQPLRSIRSGSCSVRSIR